MNIFLHWLVLLVFLLFVCRSASIYSHEFRHVHRNVCVRRSENNLDCWYSPFTLGQISFSSLDCLFQATWPASVRTFSCLLLSCHRTTEVTDPDFYVGSKNPNSCPLISVVGTLLTKPSAQLFVSFLGHLSTQPSLCPGWPSASNVPLPHPPSFWGSSMSYHAK